MKSFILKSLRLPLTILAFHALSATAFATPPTITQQPQITSFSLLHIFTGGNDGGNPTSSLIQGTDGRLYGTTQFGGDSSNGNIFAVNPDGTGYVTLYSFTGGDDGSNPYSGLIQGSDGRLYGTTPFNGVNSSGTVFAVNSDGTSFVTLYSFTAGSDGGAPTSNLIQGPNGRLYGTTTSGGTNNFGTVFAINPDGTNFATLVSFSGINDGAYPSGGLILGTDGRLYGITPGSASTSNNSFGTVFAVNPAGTGFTTLYTFTNGSDGAQPFGGLVQGTDGRLYGTTAGIESGPSGSGTVFAMNPDGTGFTTLYSFTGGSDGAAPQSSLIQETGGRLYGTDVFGGTNNGGAVFSLNPDGTSFTALYNFTSGNDGSFSEAGLIHGTDGRLYGMTQNGGPDNSGTLFAISSQVVPAGSNATFTVAATGTAPLSYQWEFNGVDIAGATSATFTITNVTTANAGSYTVIVSNAEGSATSTSATLALTSAGLPSTPVFTPPAGTYSTAQSISISSTGANSIYYTTDGSTPTTASTLYTGAISVSTTTTLSAISVNTSGSSPVMSGTYVFQIPPQITLQPTIALLHSFTDGNDGANPYGGLIHGTDGRLYGTAQVGGMNDAGTVYAINADGTGFTALYTFTGGNDGAQPIGGLIQGADGRLYGTTSTGGADELGTLFAVNPNGTGFATLYYFTGGIDGAHPKASLIQGIDGRLYGTTTQGGGVNDLGTVFALNPDGTGFATLYSFTNGNPVDNVPAGIIQGTDGRLYGTISGGGVATNHGTVFAVNSNGTGFVILYSFTGGNDGALPIAGLIQGTDGRLYGTATQGGSTGNGTLFALNPDGTGFTTLYSFTNTTDGRFPAAGLIQGTDGRLYGTAESNGTYNGGTVFVVNTDGTNFATLYSFTSGSDGGNPFTSLLQTTDGRLYGTTAHGANGFGTVFAIASPHVFVGTNVTYSVTASGTGPLSYQWQSNGVNINGATNPTLSLTNVTLSNSSSYTVVVSNPYGSVTSVPVALAVLLPPPPAAPVFSPAPATYNTVQVVLITSAGATSIYYTTNGTTPTTASTLYTGAISVPTTTTLSAIGVNAGGSSPVTSGTYAILPPSAPIFSPAPGTYSSAQSVSITSAGATSIYYTTNGTTPTTTSTLYTGPVTIATNTKLSAIGVNTAGSSPVTSGTYTILTPPSAPVFSPAPGTYNTAQSVSITSAGATNIYYTTDGTTPTTSSTLYTGAISIPSTTTLRAIGVNASGSSPITSGTYTIVPTPSAPVFSPVPGSYATAQSVSITSAGATSIYYTTNGTTPTTASTLYTGPVSIAATTKLSAIGVDAAGSSPVTSGTYTILPPPSAPVFSPVPCTYSTAQSVSITSANATHIYYTTNGGTPTTSSTLYTGPVSISTTTTLRAIGVNAAGSSPITSGTYTICIKTAPPVITHGPQSQTVNSGCNVTFTVTATSNTPLTYQWEFNGRKISCANSSTLTLHNVTTTNAGAYTVVVTNSGGSTTSAIAELTVLKCTDQHHDSDSNNDCNSQSNDDGDSHSDDDR